MTRAIVGILNDDQSVTEIYVDQNGSPDMIGEYLEKYYSDPEAIRDLLDGGDRKYIAETAPIFGGEDSFMPAERHSSLEQCLSVADNAHCDWVYINMYGFWSVMNTRERTSQLLEDLEEKCT